MKFHDGLSRKRKVTLVTVLAALVAVITALIVLLIVLLKKKESGFGEEGSGEFNSRLGIFTKSAVASDSKYCSRIGIDILHGGGSAADAAVAILFCIGVTVPQSAGIGGGFFLTFYSAANRTATTLNAREAAPLTADKDLYRNNATNSKYGMLAVAVPGELRGCWELHQKHGRLPWRSLLQPSIALAQHGVVVTEHMANALNTVKERVENEPSLSDFVDPESRQILKAGATVRQPKLAETLERIADLGATEFYEGELGDRFVNDVQQGGGIITKDDLKHYKAIWEEPVSVNLNDNLTLYSVQPPGSGVVLSLILNIFKSFNTSSAFYQESDDNRITWHHWLVEAFKFAYSQRTGLGDRYFIDIKQLVQNMTSDKFASDLASKIHNNRTFNDPSYYGVDASNVADNGTSHIAIVSPDGDAISVTTTINSYFGAVVASGSTGIILNDEMGDFTAPDIKNLWGVPSSSSNFIEPAKRPMSSMAPAVVVDNQTGSVRLVIGAAGGIRITTAIAYVAARHLFLGENIKDAIDMKRLHHQLYPMELFYQTGVDETIIRGLKRIGHKTVGRETFGSVVNAITVDRNDIITANCDYRKRGEVTGFDEIS